MSKHEDISTNEGKETFIRSFLGSVEEELLASVPKMPQGWDGHELRTLIAEKFQFEITRLMQDKRSRRYRDYRVEVLGRGL